MTPRVLVVTDLAKRDLGQRRRYLREARSRDFAERSIDELLSKLEAIADTGAQLGTSYGDDPRIRAFGYAGQATIVARFEPGTLRVLRIYFTGQDWREGH